VKLWDYELPDLLDEWDKIDDKGRDLAGIRALCQEDRFYLLVKACGRKDALHPWIYERCREVERAKDNYLDLWAREHYKDLADDTPMLTANRGWVTHGSLVVGDKVYAPDGSAVTVLALSDRYTDSECYKVTFSDGATLTAGAGHLWKVRQKVRRRVANGRAVEWVEHVIPTHTLDSRDDVGTLLAPIVGQTQQLPIHPYLLGVWLGDGHSNSGRICGIDNEIFDKVESLGYSFGKLNLRDASRFRTQTVKGISHELRALGILNNKHIPDIYLNASVHQRMELLRGLMDTDGHCNDRGTATFVNANRLLAKQVYELATGLALRPRCREYQNNKSGFMQVSMQAHTDRNPFFLQRKASRAIQPSKHRLCRTVVSVEPINSVPTRCIQVEGGMYLAGRELIPTHNSTIITFAGTIQEILINPDITIGIFSHTKGIARKFFRQIRTEIETNKTLLAAFPDILWENPSREAPRWAEETGLVVKRSSNAKEATLEAWGLVDGQPTGAHFGLRIYDDVVAPESVTTPEQIAKTTAAWELSDNLGMVGGRKWHVGTRYHFGDTYNDILTRGALQARLHPATDNGQPDGKPVLLTPEQWEEKKTIQGPATIACQMLQNPVAGQQAMFDVTDLQEYEIRPSTLNVYILVDPARSKKRGSANTAVAVIGIDAGRNKYLLDGLNHRMDLKERWQAVRDMRKRWLGQTGVQSVFVGYEAFGAQADLDYFHERMEVEAYSFPIEELRWPSDTDGSKDDRVQRLGPDLRSHKFYIPKDTKDLTSDQRRMLDIGQSYRIAKQIKARDSENVLYDLTKHFKEQVMFYPYAALKDLIDAASRIYDMNPRPPVIINEADLEPEATVD